MPRPGSELSSYTFCIHAETDAAWLVSDTGDTDNAVWLPKSQCEYEARRPNYEEEKAGGEATGRRLRILSLSVPQWLAEEKGLV